MRAERRLRGNGLAGWRNAAGAQNIRLAGRMHFPGAGPADASRRPGDQCPPHSVPHGYSDLRSGPGRPAGKPATGSCSRHLRTGRMRWFQHTVPDLTGRWIPTASHPQRDGALQPGAGGPLPWHLHVISTGSTADLHTGLVGCGDIDDGGVGQGSHDPAGIAAVGLVHPAGPAHRHAQTGGRACC